MADPKAQVNVSPLPEGDRRLLRRLYRRSFFIQTLWNYRGMQHLGLLWAQLPLLSRHKSLEDRHAFLLRSQEFYNAHPYFGTLLLGLAARLEPSEGATLSAMKRVLVSPLGALGDRIFWQQLKPFTGLISVLGLLAALPTLSQGRWSLWLLLPFSALLFYNVIHLLFRWWALLSGFQLGTKVARALSELRESAALKRLEAWTPMLSGLIVGALLMLAAYWLSSAEVERVYIERLGSTCAIAFPVWSLKLCAAKSALLFLSFLLSWKLPTRNAALPVLVALCILICVL
jgi:mannose/fructose/N-acetylgalactosamine-specific phosphotransferase system component IID